MANSPATSHAWWKAVDFLNALQPKSQVAQRGRLTNEYLSIAVNRNRCEPNEDGLIGNPELIFYSGILGGLKLTGFGLWQRPDGSRFVTVPDNLQPHSDARAQNAVRDYILNACEDRGIIVVDPPFIT